MRSIFDLNIDELEQIVETNALPDGVDLGDIASRKDFDRLFKHRLNPKYIAQIALKECPRSKPVVEPQVPREPREVRPPYQSVEPGDLKTQRMELKRQELAIKSQRQESLTYMQNELMARLNALVQGQNIVVESIAIINAKLDKVLNTDSREETPR